MTHDLKYVFACLSTHSELVNRLLTNFSDINTYFCLSFKDKTILEEFFINDGKKLLTAAYIMEEKRWREVLSIMHYVPNILSEEKLKYYWASYLKSLNYIGSIPETPIKESINFLLFVSKCGELNKIINDIVSYELMRNSVMAFQFEQHEKGEDKNIDFVKNNTKLFKADLNGSFSVVVFMSPVSKIIKKIKKEGVTCCSAFSFPNESEEIIFVKCEVTGNVKSIICNQFLKSHLMKLVTFNSLYQWIKYAIRYSSFEWNKCINFIDYMLDNNIIKIVRNR